MEIIDWLGLVSDPEQLQLQDAIMQTFDMSTGQGNLPTYDKGNLPTYDQFWAIHHS